MSEIPRPAAAASSSDDVVTKEDLLRWGMLALAGSWVGYFLFTGMPQLTLEVFPRTLVFHLLLAAGALVYLVYLAISRRLPGGTPLDWAVLALAAVYVLATIFSVNWRMSTEVTLQLAGAVIVFYVLSGLPWLDGRQLRAMVMLIGGALSLYALWVVGNDYANYLSFASDVEGLGRDNIFPATVPRVHSVSDHPNVLAMILVLIVPFFALAAVRGSSRWERLGGFAGMFTSGWAIFLTLSRGGWIGAVAAIVFTVLGAWITVRAHEREKAGEPMTWLSALPRGLTPTAIVTIGGALLLAAGGTLAFLANSSTRPGWLFRSSLSPRQDAWGRGLDIWQDNPIIGAGPGSFGMLYPAYGGRFLIHTQHAHNGFLQVADDAGALGLLALLGLAAAVVYMLARTWRDGSLEQRLVAVACAGGLIGFCLHNMLDAGNTWKGPQIALALIGAIIARGYVERAGRAEASSATRTALGDVVEYARRYGPRAARIAVLALLVLPFVAWARIDDAHRDYWTGLETWADGKEAPQVAIGHLQDAVDKDSSMQPYQLELGRMQAELFIADGRTDRALLDTAIIHLERAVALDNRSALAHATLAQAYAMAGRDDEAASEAQKLRIIARYHVPPLLVAAQVYEVIGREQDAIDTYGQLVSTDAGIADSEYWQATPFRRDHFREILEKSALGVNPCTLGSYIVQAHRTDESASLDGLDAASRACQRTVFLLPEDLVLRVAFARILMQQGQMPTAEEHLRYATDRQPDFGPARTELGRWYAAEGNLEGARHEWVVGGQLEEAESLLLLGDSYSEAGQAVPPDVIERMKELSAGSGSSVKRDDISWTYYRLRYGRNSPIAVMIRGGEWDWQNAIPRIYTQMQQALARWQRE